MPWKFHHITICSRLIQALVEFWYVLQKSNSVRASSMGMRLAHFLQLRDQVEEQFVRHTMLQGDEAAYARLLEYQTISIDVDSQPTEGED